LQILSDTGFLFLASQLEDLFKMLYLLGIFTLLITITIDVHIVLVDFETQRSHKTLKWYYNFAS